MEKKNTADWSLVERRCPWACVVSSRELAQILGVSLQTINNRKMRNQLPEPEPHSRYLPAGNRNYWRVDRIRAFLEQRQAEDINREWCRKYIESYTGPIATLEQADYVVQAAWELLGVEKPILRSKFLQ